METRWWAEAYANRKGMGAHLAGMCAIASFELWKRLKAAGIKAEVVHCDGHVLVRAFLSRSWLIDLTATQFRDDLPHTWFPQSLGHAQRHIPGFEYAYQRLCSARSLRGIENLFSDWYTEEIHPDLAAARAERPKWPARERKRTH